MTHLLKDSVKRLLTIDEAANYCSLTPSGFRAAVADGRLPGAVKGFRRYDKRALDAALNKLSGIAEDSLSEFAKWKAGKHEDQIGTHTQGRQEAG